MLKASEDQLIQILQKTLPKVQHTQVEVGIGDDGAIVLSEPGRYVFTTDSLVEGVHFVDAYSTPEEVGRKWIAVNLSDLAAMGAEPRYAFASLSLKRPVDSQWVQRVYEGAHSLLREFKVDLIGGNVTSHDGPKVLDLFMVGHLNGRALLRSQAQVGDKLAVTGYLGGAAAGLQVLKASGKSFPTEFRSLVQRQLEPRPQVKAGLALAAEAGVHSCIDVSDGLSLDLHRLLEASSASLSKPSYMGARIFESQLPQSSELTRAGSKFKQDPLEWVWYGGED
jgi:thiamine-monophosphate kinase